MSAQSEEECGVEATCLANVLLVLVHFAAKQPEYAPALCHAPHGLAELILAVGQRIHNALSELLKEQWGTSQLQSVEGSILFLVDLVSSVTEEDYRRELVNSSRK
jgi:hypothetical protein